MYIYIHIFLSLSNVYIGTSSWTKPLLKLQQRCRYWRTHPTGLHFAIKAYRIYCFSALAFVAQLCPLPPEAGQREDTSVLAMVPGPYRWVPVQLLQHLHTIGFPASFPQLRHLSLACRTRVLMTCQLGVHGVHVPTLREKEIRQHRASTKDYLGDKQRLWYSMWEPWLNHSITQTLLEARKELVSLQTSPRQIWRQVIPNQQSITMATKVAAKHKIQKYVQSRADHESKYSPDWPFRNRIQRWCQTGNHDHMVTSPIRRMRALPNSTPPRYRAARLRTFLNGWCTQSRFQQTGTCVFNCPAGRDRIENYAFCPRVRHFYRRHGCLAHDTQPLLHFVTAGLLPIPVDDPPLTAVALLWYVYQAHTILSHSKCQQGFLQLEQLYLMRCEK